MRLTGVTSTRSTSLPPARRCCTAIRLPGTSMDTRTPIRRCPRSSWHWARASSGTRTHTSPTCSAGATRKTPQRRRTRPGSTRRSGGGFSGRWQALARCSSSTFSQRSSSRARSQASLRRPSSPSTASPWPNPALPRRMRTSSSSLSVRSTFLSQTGSSYRGSSSARRLPANG